MRSVRPNESPETEAARAVAYQGYLDLVPYTIDTYKSRATTFPLVCIPHFSAPSRSSTDGFSSSFHHLTMSLKTAIGSLTILTFRATER